MTSANNDRTFTVQPATEDGDDDEATENTEDGDNGEDGDDD